MDTSAEILKAAAALLEAGGCEDVDVPVLRSVLAEKVPTGRQVRSVWSILGRYRDRLGMDYGALVPPPDGDGSTFEAHLQAKEAAYEASKAAAPAAPPSPTALLKLPLYPFQQAAVQAIEDHKGRLLVADEMGTGKSAEVLGWIALHPEALPALVICPATVRVNWCREVAKFTPFKPLLLCSKTSLKAFRDIGVDAAIWPQPGYHIVVMNYDLLEAQTPKTWTKALVEGDVTGRPLLLQAGQYALKALNWAYEKCKDMEAGARLLSVIRDIEAQGPKSNRRRFIKASVNGGTLDDFMDFHFKTVVADESHHIKDMKAQRTLAVLEIARRVPHAICLTGTPILNRPKDLWSQVYAVNRQVFPNFLEFGKRFCDGRKKEIPVRGGRKSETMEVWDFSGASNLDELDRELRERVMIRRLKSQVLKDLPKKVQVTVPIVLEDGLGRYHRETKPDIEGLAEIKRDRDAWKVQLEAVPEGDRARFLAEHAAEAAKRTQLAGSAVRLIDKIKLAAVQAKFRECVEFILDVHEQEGKVVVFVSHHKTTDRMIAELRKAGVRADFIDGRVSGAARETVKERFQEGDLEVLICGIRAAAEGLTLTASHTVVFVEFDWNPGKHAQAADRVHRIGQDMPCTIYYLVAMGTIEERIAALIDAKREVVHAALGESHRTVEEEGILDAVLDGIVGGAGVVGKKGLIVGEL